MLIDFSCLNHLRTNGDNFENNFNVTRILFVLRTVARSTFYILEGVDVYRTWVAWHGASRRRRHPFSSVQTRRRGARAYRISLINVHTEPLAVILPAYPPRRPRSRSSRRTISRIAIPSPMRNDATLYPSPNSHHYRPTLKYGATIVSLSLSRRVEDRATSFELAIFLRVWKGKAFRLPLVTLAAFL